MQSNENGKIDILIVPFIRFVISLLKILLLCNLFPVAYSACELTGKQVKS